MINKAGTLLIPSGPSHNPDQNHLHIICTNPCPEDNNLLLVPVTTWTNNLCDNACILDKGDHPFIKHKSWVIYRKVQLQPYIIIDTGLRDGRFIQQEALENSVFQRVCNGLLASKQTKLKYKKYFGLNCCR